MVLNESLSISIYSLPVRQGYTANVITVPSYSCLMKGVRLNYMDVSSSVLSEISFVNPLDRYGELTLSLLIIPSLVISARSSQNFFPYSCKPL